jgi:hypothetical protein
VVGVDEFKGARRWRWCHGGGGDVLACAYGWELKVPSRYSSFFYQGCRKIVPKTMYIMFVQVILGELDFLTVSQGLFWSFFIQKCKAVVILYLVFLGIY